jgi:hypothetical protein
MSLASAAILLVKASVKNRVRRLVKQPQNLVFLLVAGAYFSMLGGARLLAGADYERTRASFEPSRVSPWLALFVVAYLAGVWVFGADDAVLAFSEPEVAFLFPAPVSRRRLVHYKLVRTMAATLPIGAFFGFVLGRGGNPLYATLGYGLGLSTLAYHRVCASLTRKLLVDHGVSGARRRIVTLALLIATITAVSSSILGAARTLPSFDPSNPMAWGDALEGWSEAHRPALTWALAPVTCFVQIVSARRAAEVLAALPVALVVLGVHYAWAMSTDVAFEEASAEGAQKTARRLEAMRSGRLGTMPRTPPLFRLPSSGPPWVALVWKSLVAGLRVSRQQLVAWAIFFLGMPITVAATASHGWRSAIGMLAIGMAVFAALLGPHMVRNDLRQDVDRMDVLRSYPVPARTIVLGEVLGPLAMLTVVEWALLLVAVVHGIATRRAGTAFVALGCVFPLPAVTACVLVLQNLAALLFPAWAGAAARSVRGIEAFGQRLLSLVGTLMALGVVVLPAGGVAAAVSWLLGRWLGLAVAPLAGLAAAPIAFAAAFGGVLLAARAFEAFDVGEG